MPAGQGYAVVAAQVAHRPTTSPLKQDLPCACIAPILTHHFRPKQLWYLNQRSFVFTLTLNTTSLSLKSHLIPFHKMLKAQTGLK